MRELAHIFYENPIVGVAAVVLDQQGGSCWAANSSYKGLWCIPCGYVEYDEDVYEAIIREFKKKPTWTSKSPVSVRCSPTSTILKRIPWESGLKLKLPAVSSAREDLDKVDFFDLDNLPPLAFPTDAIVIEKIRQSLKRNGLSC